MRTDEKRCEIEHGDRRRAAPTSRGGPPVRVEEQLLGLGVEGGGGLVEDQAQRRARASCRGRWRGAATARPTARRRRGRSCRRAVSRPSGRRSTTGARAAAVDGVGRPGRRRRWPPGRRRPTVARARRLEAQEVLEGAARAGAARPSMSSVGEVGAVDEMRAVGRAVHAGQQLHQRGLAGAVVADDGDGRARPARCRSRSRSTGASVPG